MVDSAVLLEELRGFGISVSDEATLDKFKNLGLKWNIDEVSLVEKFIAFQRNADLPDKISQKEVDYFDREISSRIDSSKVKTNKTPLAPTSNNVLPESMVQELIAAKSQDEQSDLFSSYIPNANIPKPLIATPKLSDKVRSENTVPGPTSTDIVCTYPLTGSLQRTQPKNSQFKWPIERLNYHDGSVRYMHQPTHEKAEVLESWVWDVVRSAILSLSEETFDQDSSTTSDNHISLSQPASTDTASGTSFKNLSQPVTLTGDDRLHLLRPSSARLQSASFVAGRIAAIPSTAGLIVSDGQKTDPSTGTYTKQRLQPSNMGLIGLRHTDGNLSATEGMVRLDCARCAYSVYAGQPVVLRATNPTGNSLEVDKLFSTPLMKPPEIQNSTDEGLKLMISCGPYNLSNSTDPSLLLSLLKQVKEHRPDILILIGPLVDCKHQAVQVYAESTYEELFQNRLNSVAEYCSHLGVQLVVVPSYREAHHDPVYPTPPLEHTWTQRTPELTAWYRDVYFTWDPCMLKIGPYVFGITSVDILSHLSSEEVSFGCSGDRIARLCKHLLCSRTFYPVHPAADDLPLDYLLWDHQGRMSITPHCLIIPSRLRQFVKNVDDVLCVNPGHLSRDHSAGSYALLTIYPSSAGSENSVGTPEDSVHSICGFTQATVNRL